MITEKQLQNATSVMQGLLYHNPLYHWVAEDEKNLNVMVIGYDVYAEKFIDLCLQAGQMKDHNLYITVVSQNPDKARTEYVKARPALPRFVNIGNSSISKDEAWAVLDFIAIPCEGHAFCEALPEQNRQIVEEIMLTLSGEEHIHYLFLSIGDDTFNDNLARLFAEIAHVLENRCCINYIHKSRSPIKPQPEHAVWCKPVDVTEEFRSQSDHDALEQMAFHTHLLWTGMKNIDMQQAREKFSQPYYHEASMSFALSIGYKLQSFGITGSSADEIAANFDRQLIRHKDDDETSNQILAQIAALEHRRWVLEKVTNGWQAPPSVNGVMDFSYCIEIGSIKDNARKYHPCIVPSTASAPLKSRTYTKNRHEKWDHPGNGEEGLDALDRVSLALHRYFYQYTQKFRLSHPMEQGDAARIGRLIRDADDTVTQEYKRYCLCLRNILNREAGYSMQYDAYEKRFSDIIASTDSLDGLTKQSVADGIKNIRHSFFPVIEYSLYRDYKEPDEVLPEKLAFILTYRSSCHLAAALNLAPDKNGESDAVFQNVASATVIHPGKITYLYYVNQTSDFGLLRRKLIAIENYFQHRKIPCSLYLQILLSEDAKDRRKALSDMLNRLRKKITLDVAINPCQNETQAAEQAVLVLKNNQTDLFDGSNALFPSNRQNAYFVQKVTEQFPYFEFDRAQKRFCNDSGCDHLHYIADSSYMRVEDMFAMMNATDRQFHYPDFANEYESLWSIYTGQCTQTPFQKAVGCWNNLCMQLEDYHNTHNSPDSSQVKNLTVSTPRYRPADYRRILEALNKKGYITDFSANQNTFSFRYKLEKFKNLLTKAGEILEIYTYFEACKTGYFDDVVSSYEFKWETGGVTNELDCVLTKGFRSIIVECKARVELNQDFYYKLDSLASRFGIGTKKVLIANTYVNSPHLNQINELQKTRGNQMDIITISDENDIQNIGKTLQKIMEE